MNTKDIYSVDTDWALNLIRQFDLDTGMRRPIVMGRRFEDVDENRCVLDYKGYEIIRKWKTDHRSDPSLRQEKIRLYSKRTRKSVAVVLKSMYSESAELEIDADKQTGERLSEDAVHKAREKFKRILFDAASVEKRKIEAHKQKKARVYKAAVLDIFKK